MNKTPIITASELKEVLGSGISDSLATMHTKIATNLLCSILGVNEIITNTTTKECVEILGTSDILQFNGFPINTDSIELYDSLNKRIDSGIEYRQDSHVEQFVHLVNSSGASVNLGYKSGQVFATYESGYDITEVPEELKFATCLIAGGSIGNSDRSNGAISYKLGQKSVQFRNEGEAKAAQEIINKYISNYSNDLNVYS